MHIMHNKYYGYSSLVCILRSYNAYSCTYSYARNASGVTRKSVSSPRGVEYLEPTQVERTSKKRKKEGKFKMYSYKVYQYAYIL